MSKMNIFPKTFMYTISLLLFITLIAHGLIFFLMPSFYRHRSESELRSKIRLIMEEISSSKRDKLADIVSGAAEDMGSYIEVLYEGKYVRSLNISIAAQKGAVADSTVEKKDHYNVEMKDGLPKTDLEEAIYYSKDEMSIQIPFENHHGSYFLLRKTMQPLTDASQVIVTILPFSILICLIISVVFSLLYSRNITLRILKISEAAKRMVLLDKEVKCSIKGKDEIGMLAENINNLYSCLLKTIENLEDSYQKMHTAEQVKIDFLRAASHELKTPITAINVMLENMILGIGKYKDHEMYLPKVKKASEQLGDMVYDILEASKLESGMYDSLAAPLNIAEAVKKVLSLYAVIAKAQNIEITSEVDGALQAVTCESLFLQALSNIISNALIYNKPGGHVLIYSTSGVLCIENTGKAIERKYLEHIFEPFYRPDFARDRQSGGNGLGLYLVAGILEKLGFQYTFEPAEHIKGMEFKIWLA